MQDRTLRIPIEGVLDLHAFAPRDIPRWLKSTSSKRSPAGLREVRLIHGRGRGIQRGIVQQVLERHPLVVEFFDDPDVASRCNYCDPEAAVLKVRLRAGHYRPHSRIGHARLPSRTRAIFSR